MAEPYLHFPSALFNPVRYSQEQTMPDEPLVHLHQTHVSIHVDLCQETQQWS